MKKAFLLSLSITITVIIVGIYILGCTNLPQKTLMASPAPTILITPFASSSPIPTTTPIPSPTPDIVTLSFAGDVIFDSWVGSLIDSTGSEQILSGLNGLFKKSDISMINLETPISLRGTRENDKQFTFRAKPEHIKVLTEAGINLVTLANNHILDFGIDAFRDTVDILKSNNIKYVGAGENIDEASKPVYIKKNGTSIAILASSHVIPFVSWTASPTKPGVASTYDPSRLLIEIEKAKQSADIIVVYLHWGEEMKTTLVPYQKNLARMYIDKGADIVIGSHPHILQGIELYKKGVICYSLGNFVFTNAKKDTAVINFEITNKKISEVKVIPCEILNFKTSVLDDKHKALGILRQIESISSGIDILEDGRVVEKKP